MSVSSEFSRPSLMRWEALEQDNFHIKGNSSISGKIIWKLILPILEALKSNIPEKKFTSSLFRRWTELEYKVGIHCTTPIKELEIILALPLFSDDGWEIRFPSNPNPSKDHYFSILKIPT